MVSDEQFASDRRTRRRRLREGIGYWRSRLGDDTPIREWKLRAADSAGGSGGVSARELAASLWRWCATVNHGCCMRRRYALFGGGNFEGITKWDFCHSKTFSVSVNKTKEIATIASTGQTAFHKAGKCINEFEAEGRLRKKINYCIKKFESSEKTGHQKVMCSVVKNLTDDIKRERENCERIDFANSKLLGDIAETKFLTRKLLQSLEREKKARKLLKSVCNQLSRVVEDRKAEIAELRNWHGRVQEDVEEERKMMQMAEFWQEEHAQMKLAGAKFILEDKYEKMNSLIADAEAILRPNSATKNVKSKALLASPQTVLGKGVVDSRAAVHQHRNPHVVRAMKGHIVWPRGIQRHSTASKRLEAKLESQRILMRNVLKQR